MISDMFMDHLSTAQRLLFSRDALSRPLRGSLHRTRWPGESAFGMRSQFYRPYRCYAGAVLSDNAMPVEAAEGFEFVDREFVRGEEVAKVSSASKDSLLVPVVGIPASCFR